jgi:putative membrane protein
VHPATPYVRGWLAIVVVFFAAGRQWLEGLFGPDGLTDVRSAVPLIAGVAVGVLALVVGIFWVQWRFMSYRVTDRHVQLRRGVIMKQEREARLDRVQAVDIARPLLPRLLGLSELRFEVADGGESALKLEFLKAADAEALRIDILALAAGARGRAANADPAPAPPVAGPGGEHAPSGRGHDVNPMPDAAVPGALPDVVLPSGPVPGTGAGSPANRAPQGAAAEWARRAAEDFAGHDPAGRLSGGTEDERVVVQVPTGRLIASLLLKVGPWLLPPLAAIGVGLSLAGWGAGVLGLIPLALAGVAGLWGSFNSDFGFRAGISADGLRLRQGLTNSTHRTVPPGRVQAVQLRRPWLWRPFGWVSVHANIAGYGKAESGEGSGRSTMLPVGTLAEAAAVLALLIPDPGTEDPAALLREGLDGSSREDFECSPPAARVLSPWAWRRQGFALTRTVLMLRTGRLGRSLVLVPHERTQGMRATQGWLARSLGVASVRLATTRGPVSTVVPNVGAGTAGALLDGQVRRAAQAAASLDRNHWLAEAGGGENPRGGENARGAGHTRGGEGTAGEG